MDSFDVKKETNIFFLKFIKKLFVHICFGVYFRVA